MKLRFLAVFTFLIAIHITIMAQITPQEAALEMIRGINIGNTLEPPLEGGWNNGPVQEYFFDDYKEAGFQVVRIPVRWDEHTEKDGAFKVNDTWMNRIEEIVDWGLERDLYIIINAHHEEWIKEDYSENHKARFDSIWSQISVRFKEKSEKLFFEIINEPKGLTVDQNDDLNLRVLSIIRKTNPTRIVLYGGNEWSSLEQMELAAIPDDQYIMGYFHSYDPYTFALNGSGKWGTSSDVNNLVNRISRAAAWSTKNNIPVVLGEFGAINKCDYNSRMFHYYTYVEQSLRNNLLFQAWDDGGDFRIYQRESRKWNVIKDILIKTYIDGPTSVKVKLEEDSTVTLSWLNRTTENSSIIIERKTEESEFEEYAVLDASVSEFNDTNINSGKYFYRVIAKMDDGNDKYSYPQVIDLAQPMVRIPFNKEPYKLPNTIEAENFDIGGEGLTYHDIDEVNVPGVYRTGEGVDIEKRDDGGYQIAYVEKNEWVEYSIFVEKSGTYNITLYTASLEGGGKLWFKNGGWFSNIFMIPSTNSWQTTTALSGSMKLSEGEQILRLTILDAKPFNIDKFFLELDEATDIAEEENLPTEYKLEQNYPNPFNPTTSIIYKLSSFNHVQLRVYDLLGSEVAVLVNEPKQAGTYKLEFAATNLPSGTYFYQLKIGKNLVDTKKMLLLK